MRGGHHSHVSLFGNHAINSMFASDRQHGIDIEATHQFGDIRPCETGCGGILIGCYDREPELLCPRDHRDLPHSSRQDEQFLTGQRHREFAQANGNRSCAAHCKEPGAFVPERHKPGAAAGIEKRPSSSSMYDLKTFRLTESTVERIPIEHEVQPMPTKPDHFPYQFSEETDKPWFAHARAEGQPLREAIKTGRAYLRKYRRGHWSACEEEIRYFDEQRRLVRWLGQQEKRGVALAAVGDIMWLLDSWDEFLTP